MSREIAGVLERILPLDFLFLDFFEEDGHVHVRTKRIPRIMSRIEHVAQFRPIVTAASVMVAGERNRAVRQLCDDG